MYRLGSWNGDRSGSKYNLHEDMVYGAVRLIGVMGTIQLTANPCVPWQRALCRSAHLFPELFKSARRWKIDLNLHASSLPLTSTLTDVDRRSLHETMSSDEMGHRCTAQVTRKGQPDSSKVTDRASGQTVFFIMKRRHQHIILHEETKGLWGSGT